MSTRDRLGGIIHTYQKYDPAEFPSPTAPPPDLVSPAFEHLLHYGSMRRLTEEELARAVRIDPRQIRGLGPSLEALMALLREPGDIEQLSELQQQVQEYLRQMAEQQGLEQGKKGGFRLTPKAYRLFQSKLLTRI